MYICVKWCLVLHVFLFQLLESSSIPLANPCSRPRSEELGARKRQGAEMRLKQEMDLQVGPPGLLAIAQAIAAQAKKNWGPKKKPW